MCDNDADTPFCSPRSGTRVHPGETVEITWNPHFLAASLEQAADEIFIQADFLLASDNVPELAGFTSTPLSPSIGTFHWPVLASYLPVNSTSTTAVLSIAAPLPTTSTNGTFFRIGTGTIRFPGPSVHIVRSNTNTDTPTPTPTPTNINPASPPSATTESTQQQQEQQRPQAADQNGPNPLAIALPIALGLLVALVVLAYLFLRRRRPDLLARLSWGGRGRRRGYGERKSRDQRVRLRGKDVEIRVVRDRAVGVEGLGGGFGWGGAVGSSGVVGGGATGGGGLAPVFVGGRV